VREQIIELDKQKGAEQIKTDKKKKRPTKCIEEHKDQRTPSEKDKRKEEKKIVPHIHSLEWPSM